MHGYFSFISVSGLLGRVSIASLMKQVGQVSLENELCKDVSNHDVMGQMTGFPVSFQYCFMEVDIAKGHEDHCRFLKYIVVPLSKMEVSEFVGIEDTHTHSMVTEHMDSQFL
jgi:hypothetical protein